MKKFFVSLFILLAFGCFQNVSAVEDIVSLDEVEQVEEVKIKENEPLELKVVFDWIDITQVQRDENIEKYHKLLFDDNTSRIYFTNNNLRHNLQIILRIEILNIIIS